MQVTNLLLSFLLTAAFTCNKGNTLHEEGNIISLSYAQTQCADPWQTTADDKVTAQSVKQYLETAGLYVASVSIKRTYDGAACLACTCPSGKTIYVATYNNDSMRAKLSRLGFK